MNRCSSMKGQRNFSIHVPSHGFENNEALVDGRCSGTGFGGSVGPVEVTSGDVLVFILFIL